MKWTSVKDGLPEDDDLVEKYDDGNLTFCTVLSCNSDGLVDMTNRRMLRHDFGPHKATEGWEWCTNKKITHWMPLPEPPEEEILYEP